MSSEKRYRLNRELGRCTAVKTTQDVSREERDCYFCGADTRDAADGGWGRGDEVVGGDLCLSVAAVFSAWFL